MFRRFRQEKVIPAGDFSIGQIVRVYNQEDKQYGGKFGQIIHIIPRPDGLWIHVFLFSLNIGMYFGPEDLRMISGVNYRANFQFILLAPQKTGEWTIDWQGQSSSTASYRVSELTVLRIPIQITLVPLREPVDSSTDQPKETPE